MSTTGTGAQKAPTSTGRGEPHAVRGVVVRSFGPLETHKLETVAIGEPGPEEILIDVHAIGVNFPDTLMMQGLYQTRPETPFVPGRDAAGVVAQVGSRVTRVGVGDRVTALVTYGAYAEQLIAPQARCFRLPDELDYVTAAAMTTVYKTAYVALMVRAAYQPGEKVLVVGAGGGVGLACVQVAKAKGATVIAGDISEDKRALAREGGADHTIDLAGDVHESLRQQVFAATGGSGVDIVLDPVGGDVFDAAIRALAFAGRIVVIGFASGRIPVAKAGYFNVKNLTLAGLALDLHFRHRPDLMNAVAADLFEMYRKGQIRPEVTAVYPLEEFQQALAKFGERRSVGKMVLTTGRG